MLLRVALDLHCVPPKPGTLWPITFTNIDQYQCHLIELFLQYYLIIYCKNYSHSRVPAATVTVATSALVQTSLCYYIASTHRARATVEYLRQATPDFISPDVWPPNSPDVNPVDYRICGCLQKHVYQKHTCDINELKQHLVDVWSDFGQTVIDGAIDEWRKRLQACVRMKGRHCERVL